MERRQIPRIVMAYLEQVMSPEGMLYDISRDIFVTSVLKIADLESTIEAARSLVAFLDIPEHARLELQSAIDAVTAMDLCQVSWSRRAMQSFTTLCDSTNHVFGTEDFKWKSISILYAYDTDFRSQLRHCLSNTLKGDTPIIEFNVAQNKISLPSSTPQHDALDVPFDFAYTFALTSLSSNLTDGHLSLAHAIFASLQGHLRAVMWNMCMGPGGLLRILEQALPNGMCLFGASQLEGDIHAQHGRHHSPRRHRRHHSPRRHRRPHSPRRHDRRRSHHREPWPEPMLLSHQNSDQLINQFFPNFESYPRRPSDQIPGPPIMLADDDNEILRLQQPNSDQLANEFSPDYQSDPPHPSNAPLEPPTMLADDDVGLLRLEHSNSIYWAILAASSQGHIDVVRMLLDNADMSMDYCIALKAASENGHAEVVQLLLDVTPWSFFNVDALLAASLNGHVNVVRMLLDKAPTDMRLDTSDSLHAASDKGDVEVVQLLLDYEAAKRPTRDEEIHAPLSPVQPPDTSVS